MNVKVINSRTGAVALYAASERIARNWLNESVDSPSEFLIVDDDRIDGGDEPCDELPGHRYDGGYHR